MTFCQLQSVNVLSRAPLRRCVVRMVSVHVNQTLEGVPVAGVIQASTATQTVLVSTKPTNTAPDARIQLESKLYIMCLRDV